MTQANKWSGRTLSAIAILFLSFDIVLKLMQHPMAVQGTKQLGYPAGMILPLGIIELIALILYLVPRTSLFGVIIWTGYLGGAVATHVRISDPLFSHILFPTYVAALLWGGLVLRDARFRALLASN